MASSGSLLLRISATISGVSVRPRNLPEFQLYQLFIKDPDGITIELNFWGITAAPDWGGENYAEMPRVA